MWGLIVNENYEGFSGQIYPFAFRSSLDLHPWELLQAKGNIWRGRKSKYMVLPRYRKYRNFLKSIWLLLGHCLNTFFCEPFFDTFWILLGHFFVLSFFLSLILFNTFMILLECFGILLAYFEIHWNMCGILLGYFWSTLGIFIFNTFWLLFGNFLDIYWILLGYVWILLGYFFW